jgi:hypothetical protein
MASIANRPGATVFMIQLFSCKHQTDPDHWAVPRTVRTQLTGNRPRGTSTGQRCTCNFETHGDRKSLVAKTRSWIPTRTPRFNIACTRFTCQTNEKVRAIGCIYITHPIDKCPSIAHEHIGCQLAQGAGMDPHWRLPSGPRNQTETTGVVHPGCK